MNNFFIITALGFEAETEKEIHFWLSLKKCEYKTKIAKGGVELSCPLLAGFELNFHLKLATRILLRLEEFPVYFFNELEKKIKKIQFNKYYHEGVPILIKVDAKKSKLGQEKKIFEVFKEVFKKNKVFSKPTEAPQDALILYVDIFKDICRLSFDTTGEPLYKRSSTKLNSEAPMRETIAHWGLLRMLESTSPWEKPLSFVDPFCGSGTLLIEALNFFANNKREFAFESVNGKMNLAPLKEQQFPFVNYQAIDISAESLEICKTNLRKSAQFEKIHFRNEDSSKINLKHRKESHYSWIYSNLPYGKRLENHLPKNLIEILYQNYQPKIIGLFHPEKWNHEKAVKTEHLKIENGGLKLYFSILRF